MVKNQRCLHPPVPMIAHVLSAFFMAVLIAGCEGAKMKPVKSTPMTGKVSNDSPDSKTTPNVTGDRCADLLASAVDTMRPDRLGISSTPEYAADVLNNWLTGCGGNESSQNSGNSPKESPWFARLNESQQQILLQTRIDTDDVEHIRDCMIDRKATDAATARATNDLDRVVQLFYYVTRAISITPPKMQIPQFTPYETMMFGQGTAESRAWVFANMLRQLRIDAVIIRPTVATTATEPATSTSAQEASALSSNAAETPAEKSDNPGKSEKTESTPSDEASDSSKSAETKPAGSGKEPEEKSEKSAPKPWLVGVLLNNEAYLFDMQLGWPIPSPADNESTATPRQPATLREVLADDALLRKLDLDTERPYPLHSADLNSPRIEIISSAHFWTKRMRLLQNYIPPIENRTVVIFDGLDDAGGGKGVVSRILESGAGTWNRDQIDLWPYPAQIWKASHNRNQIQEKMIEALWFPYQAPVAISFNPDNLQPEKGEPARSQLKTRIAQITGEYAKARTSYLTIQLSEYPPAMPLSQKIYDELLKRAKLQGIPEEKVPNRYQVPQDVWYMHNRAAEDAKFWVAITQYDLAEYGAAIDSFAEYLKRYRNEGRWSASAAVFHAISQAENQRLAEAVFSMTQALQLVPQDHPQRNGFELLQNRWRKVRRSSTEQKEQSGN